MAIYDLSRTAAKARSIQVASIIRICPADEPRTYDFNLADFSGQLPACGDLIVKPRSGGPSAAPEIWEVIGRLFDPGRSFDAGGCLRVRVRTRPPTDDEVALIR